MLQMISISSSLTIFSHVVSYTYVLYPTSYWIVHTDGWATRASYLKNILLQKCPKVFFSEGPM